MLREVHIIGETKDREGAMASIPENRKLPKREADVFKTILVSTCRADLRVLLLICLLARPRISVVVIGCKQRTLI